MRFFGGIVEISTISIDTYPGDESGDSMVATLASAAELSETAQLLNKPGIIGNPPKGTKALRLRIGSLDLVVGSINYNVDQPANQGETKLYSTDADGNEAASHYMDNDGNHIFNDGTDFAVRYSELETAFNELNDKFNNLVTALNTVIGGAPIPEPGNGSPSAFQAALAASFTSSAPLDSVADIAPSKIEEIKVP